MLPDCGLSLVIIPRANFRRLCSWLHFFWPVYNHIVCVYHGHLSRPILFVKCLWWPLKAKLHSTHLQFFTLHWPYFCWIVSYSLWNHLRWCLLSYLSNALMHMCARTRIGLVLERWKFSATALSVFSVLNALQYLYYLFYWTREHKE